MAVTRTLDHGSMPAHLRLRCDLAGHSKRDLGADVVGIIQDAVHTLDVWSVRDDEMPHL